MILHGTQEWQAIRRVAVLMLVTAVAVAAVASCGAMGMGSGGQRMQAPQPKRVEGFLSEMSVEEFFQGNCAVCHGDRRQGGSRPRLLPSALLADDDF